MDQTGQLLVAANHIYARANETSTDPATESRPPAYKAIGISLAVASGCFIGVSFVLKKVGLLKANEKYNEIAGEGYGYLKNAFWWGGMTLMIIGELCNFAAYAFTDAILVTSLGALSVVITAVLSAIFLKERLSMVGKVACFLCIVGSVIIVLNAPEESSVATIQELQKFVITPGFLSYIGVIIVGSAFVALWVAPRYGKKNMFPYISVCSWIGGLSVVATQGLGAAIVAQAGGTPQFNQWFVYVVLVFVIGTLLTEIIYLNKALNLFNAAMVTPTYYVYFTSTTMITSAVLFQGFKGTAMQIVTVVMGFLTICAGVVLLQLSKSAKDVPDAAVFAGDLDQIHTIAEQEQPETEPKADAIRGAAAIVRRISLARQKMEEEEFRRLREEKELERLAPVSEDGQQLYEWDGLRRRRTGLGSYRSRATTSPSIVNAPAHPPLGRSRFFTEEELAEERSRQMSPGMLSSIAGTIRSRARSVLLPGHPEFSQDAHDPRVQSPMHPVQLSEIAVPGQKYANEASPYSTSHGHIYGLPNSLQRTEYEGAASIASGSTGRHIQFTETPKPYASVSSLAPPTPPPHGEVPVARRQFSFQNVFRRHQADSIQEQALPSPRNSSSRHGIGSRGYSERQVKTKNASEEERLGLVKGDSRSMPTIPRYDEDDYDEEEESEDGSYSDDKRAERYGRGITNSPPRRSDEKETEYEDYESRRWNRARSDSEDTAYRSSPPRPPGHNPPRGRDGAFI
ncbi:putative magnesium transporter NIPA4 [Daldinia childiae]|uniref:putative magnesium transporter NIPA4 n=1 Tax=Daldinia childiae TaxID=326645 RepID=UPI0014489C84|nr:putative magnesium transporter NIPA4 [Daldinia childiae]KAF3061903.1 putative magnesium transporter NIPA4 [Daldinia childiae]